MQYRPKYGADLLRLNMLIRNTRSLLTSCSYREELNRACGRNTAFYGATGLTREWRMKQKQRSPRYTTRWSDILSIP